MEPVAAGPTIRFGIATVAVAFGSFGLWSALAPLDAAAVARGEVMVQSYRKTVQHQEGGIVKTLLVRDGDRVGEGQPLVLLDDTAVRARWQQLVNQRWDALATRARLVAERDNAAEIDFSALPAADHPHVAEVRRAQTNLFHARRQLIDGQVSVLEKRIVQMGHEAEALEAEQRSKDRQLTLIREEVATTESLFARGLALKPRLLQLKRTAEQLHGERDDYSARIARLRQSAAGTELEIANLTYRRLDEVATGLRDVEADLRDLDQQLTAVEDSLSRTVIRAPQAGVVMGMKAHTIGGVLRAGEPILDVVPGNETLVVEAHISPEDIDRVHPGRPAQVRLRTFLRGLTPPAFGTVTRVSADLMHDETTRQPYYLARIALDPHSLARLPGPLQPGMQADVLIVTGQRTALQFFLDPLTRGMAMAMREK